MIEPVQRSHSASDALFLERLDAFMEKSIADIKAFAERESRPFEEVAAVSRRSPFSSRADAPRPGNTSQNGMLDIFSNRETLGVTKVLPAMSSISLSLRRAFILVRTSLCHASRILETLFETAGVQSFLLAVDPADAADAGFLGGSLTGREFWRRMRNGGETGARAFKTYCIKEMPASQPPFEQGSSADVTDAPETTVKRTTAKNVKSELYEKAREALRYTALPMW